MSPVPARLMVMSVCNTFFGEEVNFGGEVDVEKEVDVDGGVDAAGEEDGEAIAVEVSMILCCV
jgi:hypothetical protein